MRLGTFKLTAVNLFAQELLLLLRAGDPRIKVVYSLAAIFLCPSVSSAGIIAQWHFDEAPGSTIAVDSVGEVDGSLAGNAAFVAGGISGNAVSVSFEGGGLVNMGDNFPFTSGDFSIVAWAKTAAGDTTPNYFVATKHRSTFVAGYLIGINVNGPLGATDKAWFFDSNGSPGDQPISTTAVNDGQWHQIVAVYHNGGMSEIYVDGAGVEDSKPADPIGSTAAPFLIGGIDVGGTPTSVFKGLMDEVQLYDHALTDSQIQFLFDNPSLVVPEPSSLVILFIGLAAGVFRFSR